MTRLAGLGVALFVGCTAASTATVTPAAVAPAPSGPVWSCEVAPVGGLPPRPCPDGCEEVPSAKCDPAAKIGDACATVGARCLRSGTVGRCKGPLGGTPYEGIDPCAPHGNVTWLICAPPPKNECYSPTTPVP